VFAVTAEGSAALERRTDLIAEIEARTGVRLRPHDAIDAAVGRLLVAVREAERHAAATEVVAVLERTAADLTALTHARTLERGRR
jgi:hypothetical protein